MKRILKITALAITIMLGSSLRNKTSAQQVDATVSYQTFYDELSPYGSWVDYPEQGYVWVPDAGSDFRPYATNGHWVWTDDYEWMWVSDYEWGWAPFHYGRWMEDSYYGWIWVPGYEWSPAWVAWRDGGDYYGWAPLRPGINISINFSIGSYSPPYDYWSFAPRRYITSPRIYDYCYDRGQNITIINQTTIINNYRYNRNVFVTGPRRGDVERYTGRITPVRFRDAGRPGRTQFRNNEVSIYRPNVQRDDQRRFAPRQFDRYDRNAVADNNRSFRNDRNNNRTERSNNLPRRDDNVINRDNNSPTRERGRTFDRRNDNGVRQQQDANTNNDRRQLERRTPGNQTNPVNPGNDTRRFERRNIDRSNEAPVRQRPETRNDNNTRPQRPQMEPRTQQQPRQMEPRTQPQPRQMEPRTQQQPRQMEQRRQEQPRQFERRNDSRDQNSNGRGNGRRRS